MVKLGLTNLATILTDIVSISETTGDFLTSADRNFARYQV